MSDIQDQLGELYPTIDLRTKFTFPLLDHGYVKFILSYGSDEMIIEAARMSTDKGFKGWGTKETPGDEKLLAYLYRNKHHTPFEMAGLILEIKAPIFVFREWHRHRTQSYNEMSARYVPLPNENYLPSVDRLMAGASSINKQAGVSSTAQAPLTEFGAGVFRSELKDLYRKIEDLYQTALHNSVPKELARLPIPVARYSKMRAHANLRNWLNFLTLRMAPDAQWEIRQYANAVGEIIKNFFPKTWELFIEGKPNAQG